MSEPTKAEVKVEVKVKPLTAMERVDKLERCVAKMAHYLGGGCPRVLKEFGYKEWTPGKPDMTKFKQG